MPTLFVIIHAARPRRAILGVMLLASNACAPTSPPAPAPAPSPVPAMPTEAERARARADSVAARARADSVRDRERADSARMARASRAVSRRRYAALARPSARNDTLATRELEAPVRVCSGGDVTLGSNLDPRWSRMAANRMRRSFGRSDEPESLLAPLRPLVEGADIVLVNVESAIGEGSAPSKCGPRSTRCFAFRAPPPSAPALRTLAPDRVVVGNVANNHSRDAGNVGQDSTVALLRRAGVLVTGYDTLATAVPTPSGDTIGVLGFYTSTETPDARDTAAVRRHVARAADRYPFVIVTMHLGAEGRRAQNTRDATERFLGADRGNPVAFADAAVRGGAGLVVGHGPHVMRAIEWRDRGALIAYSLGNLLTYGPFNLREPLNRGAVLCATVDTAGRVSAASLASTVQRSPGILERDRAHRASVLVDSLSRIDFPATGARLGASGELRPRGNR